MMYRQTKAGGAGSWRVMGHGATIARRAAGQPKLHMICKPFLGEAICELALRRHVTSIATRCQPPFTTCR
ncbi:hypothetical protein HYQ46_003390 [Verticillium longisporum]|nr:hypothetical protein HYQ46_003390 [Verticillium longisporum]